MINTTKLGDSVVAENDKTIITRIQNRRGLKQDLPKPLRPGEIGFATDSRQIYIGADTSVTTDSYNKTAKFENVLSAKTTATDLVTDNIIQFKVPHRRYNRNFFNGAVTFTWFPTSYQQANATSGDTVFVTGETVFTDLQGSGAFGATGITVVKNGFELSADGASTASHSNIRSGFDYYFSSGSASNSTHQLTFRTAPEAKDEIGVTYYSNADIYTAITTTNSSSNDIGYGGAGIVGVPGFHAGYNIPSYREIEKKNIRIAASTGVGLIGLNPKHTVIATDVKNTPVAPNFDNNGQFGSATLGNILASRNIQNITSVSGTVANPSGNDYTFTVATGATHYSNFDGKNYAVVSDAATSTWLNGKVLDINTNNATNVVLDLPANTATTVRTLTSINDADPLAPIIAVSNEENIENGDTLYFIDNTNVASLNGEVGTVTAGGGSTSLTVTLSNACVINNTDYSNISFITRKAGVASNIVIISNNHGFADGEEFHTPANTTIVSGNTAVVSATDNTFTAVTVATQTSILEFPVQPYVQDATVSIVPVYNADLLGNTDLQTAMTVVNNDTDFPWSIGMPPAQINSRIYLEENQDTTKNSIGFKLYDDVKGTNTRLGLVNDSYTKSNSTVKSKLEQWLEAVKNNTNMISSVGVNNQYSSVSSGNVYAWAMDIDTATNEAIFVSSEEARNFTSILNNVYFDTENADIRGLLNVKTNIEILTLESQEAGDSDATFTAPLGATLDASVTTRIADLEVDATNHDAHFVEYSMKDRSANTSLTYKRIGTLQITGDVDAQQALFLDNYSDLKDGYTGNVQLTATYDAGTDSVKIDAVNTLSPGVEIDFIFIRRKYQTALTTS